MFRVFDTLFVIFDSIVHLFVVISVVSSPLFFTVVESPEVEVRWLRKDQVCRPGCGNFFLARVPSAPLSNSTRSLYVLNFSELFPFFFYWPSFMYFWLPCRFTADIIIPLHVLDTQLAISVVWLLYFGLDDSFFWGGGGWGEGVNSNLGDYTSWGWSCFWRWFWLDFDWGNVFISDVITGIFLLFCCIWYFSACCVV